MEKFREPMASITFSARKGFALKKIFRMVRFTLFCFFLSLLQVMAVDSYSQQTRLTLNQQNQKLEDVLKAIEDKSDFFFLYNKDLINVDQMVNIDAKDQTIKVILDELLKETDIKYSVVNRQIILSNLEGNSGLNSQQQKSVSGKVTDTSGSPLPGVSVVVKGTTIGTITDSNGYYSISNLPANVTLQFSFVGMKTQEVKVENRTSINISLAEDAIGIDEVVAVGYGTQKKRDIIGSVATVKSIDIVKSSSFSLTTGLQGKAAGLNIIQSSAGTKVQVRGIHSINSGNDPLWVVDGVPTDANINPQDIESVEVLKDASATAIYGSRGSNGVILITTKKGEKNKTSIKFDYQGGARKLTKNWDDYGYVNSSEFIQIMDKATANSGVVKFDPESVLKLSASNLAYTNLTYDQAKNNSDSGKLIDALSQTGLYDQLNMSISAGNDKGTTYLSGSYVDEKSYLVGNKNNALHFRVNSDYKIFPSVTVGSRSFISFENKNTPNSGGQKYLVWKPIYNSSDPYNTGYWNSYDNPVAKADPAFYRNDTERIRALVGGYAEVDLNKFVKGLALRTETNFERSSIGNSTWASEFITFPETNSSKGSTGSESNSITSRFHYNFYLKFNRNFGHHTFGAVFGTESERITSYLRAATGRFTEGTYPQLGNNPGEKTTAQGYLSFEEYIRSYFGRGEYKYKDRYLAGISLRRDGVSNFAPENRWGTFTAYSIGWILSEESFMKPLKWLSLAKLRGSIGQTGNKAVPNKFNTTWTNSINWIYGQYDYAQIGGTRPSNIGNRDLTWETTTSYDFGLDFGLFNNRLNGSAAYYFQDVDGLVLAAQMPSSTGLGTTQEIWGNMGRIQNKGMEFSLTSINVNTSDFKWTTTFNITTNKNKVLNLTPQLDKNNVPLYERKAGFDLISKSGQGVREFYMPEFAGVDPEKGIEMIYEIDYDKWKSTGEIVKTGRKIPATQENLKLNKVALGKSITPTFYGGLNNSMEYKGFDFNFLLVFGGGNYIYDDERRLMSNPVNGSFTLDKKLLNNSWEKPGDIADYPQLVFNQVFNYNWDPNAVNPNSPTGKGDWKTGKGNYLTGSEALSRYLEKGDFVKLKHIEFGYSLPSNLMSKIRIANLRVYLAADDLYTLTPFRGWDPQTGALSNGVIYGGDWAVPASYSMGVQLKF